MTWISLVACVTGSVLCSNVYVPHVFCLGKLNTRFRWQCKQLAVGRYWKVGEYQEQGVFLQEPRADDYPAIVAFWDGVSWLLCTLDPLPNQKKNMPREIGKGIVLEGEIPSNWGKAKWHFPASSEVADDHIEVIYNDFFVNDWYCMASSDLQAFGAEEAVRRKVVKAMHSELSDKDLEIIELKKQLGHYNWYSRNYQGIQEPSLASLAEARKERLIQVAQPDDEAAPKGKGKGKPQKAGKYGWMNKMIALLGAHKVGKKGKLNYLVNKFLGFVN
jgi:hypothetical protein